MGVLGISQTADCCYWALHLQTAWETADQIYLDSPTADYWALRLQMETRTGWKMVYQILKDSLTAGTWANPTVKDSQTA